MDNDASAESRSMRDSLNRTRESLGNAAGEAMNAAASDLDALRNDLNNLKATLGTFLSQASGEAVKSARELSAGLTEAGFSAASTAADRGKGLLHDIENATQRNPLAALAGALAIGVLLGALGRRR